MVAKKTKKVKKTKSKKVLSLPVKTKKNTTDYYDCLANTWGTGKITDCCSNCKKNAGVLAANRQQEISKLTSAYQQLGVSLTNLLKPIKVKH